MLVKPNIKYLTLSILYRHGDTPIQVASHRTRLQVHISIMGAKGVGKSTLIRQYLKQNYKPWKVMA